MRELTQDQKVSATIMMIDVETRPKLTKSSPLSDFSSFLFDFLLSYAREIIWT